MLKRGNFPVLGFSGGTTTAPCGGENGSRMKNFKRKNCKRKEMRKTGPMESVRCILATGQEAKTEILPGIEYRLRLEANVYAGSAGFSRLIAESSRPVID